MGRKKMSDTDSKLTEIIMLRVTEKMLAKLNAICTESDCSTVPEVIRRIIDKEKIILFHKDAAMDAPMEVLAAIQMELRAIGININQVTRALHSMTGDQQRWHQVRRAAEYYKEVDIKVGLLLTMIAQLAKKWLQK